MLITIVDSALLSVPTYGEDEDAVHRVLGNLVGWARAVRGDSPIKLAKLSDTDEVLLECGCWPIHDQIEEWLAFFGLQEVFAVKDLANSYLSISRAAIPLEESTVELTVVDNVVVSPNILAGHGPASLVKHSEKVYSNAAASFTAATHLKAVASGIPQLQASSVKVVGSAVSLSDTNIAAPVKFKGTAKLLNSIDDLGTAIRALDLWNTATGVQDIYLAITVRAAQIANAMGCAGNLRNLRSFSLGSEFYGSLPKIQASPGQPKAKTALEACARVVASAPKYPLHPMGKPKQSKRQRDGASALRTHISKKHEAPRLMLWETADQLEFANVGTKFELVIEEGALGNEFTYAW